MGYKKFNNPIKETNILRKKIILYFCVGLFLLLLNVLWFFLDVTGDLEATHHFILKNGQWKVALVSDLHIRPGQESARKSLEILWKEDFDLLFFLGDMVDSRFRLKDLENFFLQLPKRGQRFAILGNWEYWSGIAIKMKRFYQNHGVRLLVNEAIRVKVPNNDEILLVGLDDRLAGNLDWGKAIAGYENWRGPILVLSHSPASYDDVLQIITLGGMENSIQSLMLSGHTHGGQIKIFGWVLDFDIRHTPYLAGWYNQEKRFSLYVSRGIGTSILPVRIGVRPEVVFFNFGQ
ncbi:putative Metallophosphoesterase [Gammaproteobacteria bacterium]